MTNREIAELSARVLAPNYRRAPVAFREGRGMRLWDADGKEYLDFLAGIAVDVLGHGHPRLVTAIQQQAARLIHVSNLFEIPEQARLAERLVPLTGIPNGRAFFCNSGAEAAEAAIKLARKAGRARRGPDAYEIIVASHSFHGRTMGALAATMNPRYHEGFEPILPGFVETPFNDLAAVERATGPKTAAVLVEPVQGEGGIHPADDAYLAGLRRLCDAHGILLMLDEIQCGMGRTGRWFAYQHAAIVPDVVLLAKGLGGGVPIGAVVAREDVMQVLQPGTHGSTFGGNPLACAAGLAVLETIDAERLVENAGATGAYLIDRLRGLMTTGAAVTGVRGRGLMVAAEVTPPSDQVTAACLARGLLVNNVRPTSIRFVPPLIATRADVDRAVELFAAAVADAAARPAGTGGPGLHGGGPQAGPQDAPAPESKAPATAG
jgi:acetylornithine/N-succinyldiaminopimelate aminotransferase